MPQNMGSKENLTSKNILIKVACEQALYLGDIVKSRRAKAGGGAEKRELATITHKSFSFPPRKPRDTAKRRKVTIACKV